MKPFISAIFLGVLLHPAVTRFFLSGGIGLSSTSSKSDELNFTWKEFEVCREKLESKGFFVRGEVLVLFKELISDQERLKVIQDSGHDLLHRSNKAWTIMVPYGQEKDWVCFYSIADKFSQYIATAQLSVLPHR